MRHIINLITSLPSTQRNRLMEVLERLLPQYNVLVVDDWQPQTPEEESQNWRKVWMTALQADNSIIISQGASENLPLLLDRLWRAPGTNIVTITLGAEPSEWEVWLMEQLPADFR